MVAQGELHVLGKSDMFSSSHKVSGVSSQPTCTRYYYHLAEVLSLFFETVSLFSSGDDCAM